MKKVTNDQQHIIDALIACDYIYVWMQVKYIGYNYVHDINERYTIFMDCVENFDYERNNNFIQYYKNHMKYYLGYKNDTFYVSQNKTIINKLKSENISPTECKKSRLVQELKKWGN